VFGSSGAGGMLSKLTAFMAVHFILTSLSYTLSTSNPASEKSVILDVRLEDSAPPAPGASPEGGSVVDPLDQTGKTQ
jgi:preprotein translocase subunit SecG